MSGEGGADNNVQRNHQSAFIGTGAENPPQTGMVAGQDVGAAADTATWKEGVLFLRIHIAVSSHADGKRGKRAICDEIGKRKAREIREVS